MTTPGDVVAIAEQVRANGDIYRDPPGWDSYVSIQQSPPYEDGRFGRGLVQHCGISVSYVLTKAGLVMGRDYPSDIQYAPALVTHANIAEPQVGAVGVINWDGGVADHVVLVVGVPGDGTVQTWEANTTAGGEPEYYTRSLGLFDGFIMPSYDGATRTAPAFDPTPIWATIAAA